MADSLTLLQWPAGPELRVELTPRRCLTALTLAAFGAAANCFELRPFVGVGFAVGAIAPLFASFTLGTPLAMAVAFLSYLPTLYLWEQPLSLTLAVAEAGVLSSLYTRGRFSPYQSFLLFWLVVGLPLAYWAARQVGRLPEPTLMLVVFKYPINSLLALLMAMVMLRIPRLVQLAAVVQPPRSLRLTQLLVSTYAPVVIASLLFFALSIGHLAHRRYMEEQERLIRETANSVALELASNLEFMRRAILDAASDIEVRGVGDAQTIIEKFHRAYPAFATLLVTDAAGTVVASAGTLHGRGIDPARSIGNSVADRAYFKVPRASGQFFTSNGFKGRSVGADEIFALAAPIKGPGGQFNGVVETSILLNDTTRGEHSLLRRSDTFTIHIVDGEGRVILTGDPARYAPLDSLRLLVGPTRFAPGDIQAVSQEVPTRDGKPNRMYLRSLAPVPGLNWDVVVELSLDKVLSGISQGYMIGAIWALVAWVISIIVTRAVSRQITAPFDYILSLAGARREKDAGQEPPAGMPAELMGLGQTLADYNEELRRAVRQRDQANQALTELTQDLERQVAARTMDFQLATQRAEQASRVKSEFLAHMSHELRTPLNTILGSVQMLTREKGASLGEVEARRLQQITASGALLRDLIEDVLDLAKVESGTVDFNPVRLDAAKVIRDCVEILGAAIAGKGHRLEVRIGVEDTRIVSDYKRLRQILVNLLGNAVKFTPPGGRLEVALEAGPAKSLRFLVSDNGRGMSAAEQERVFEPFVRGAVGNASPEPGTGLGLALVRRLVEAHGGSISVRSIPGEGSCFTVELPRAAFEVPEVPPAPPEPVQTTAAAPSSSRREKPLVLIAEDHAPNAELLAEFCQLEGMDTQIASNGGEAVALARSHLPDLILMDWKMPVLEGPEAIRMIRGHEPTAKVPIIALTAFAQPQDAARMAEVGANAFLTKPIDFDRLLAVLQKYRPAAGQAPADRR